VTTETGGVPPLFIIGGLGIVVAAVALYVIPRTKKQS